MHNKYVIGEKYKNSDLHGKVFIVTGSNTGIGFQAVAQLVSMNATVIMACRSISKANAARDQILRQVQCAPSKVLSSSEILVLPIYFCLNFTATCHQTGFVWFRFC